MTTKTSCAFQAILPGSLSNAALESINKWGRETCEAFSIETCSDATAIVAIRDTQKSVRGSPRLLRTSLQTWGVELPSKQNGWLSLLMLDEAKETLAHQTPQRHNHEHTARSLQLPTNLLKMRRPTPLKTRMR